MLFVDHALSASRLRYAYWAMYVGWVMLLGWLLGLSWWCWLIFLLVSAALWWSATIKLPKLRHIAMPNASDRDQWQFLVETAQGEMLWQGTLGHIKDLNHCLRLEVRVTIPMPTKQRFLIFPDQLPQDAYRQLKVLARMF